MKTATTKAARAMARGHNKRIAAGFAGNGFLVFDAQTGEGGAWYSADSRPVMPPGAVKLWIGRERRTAAQIQQWLDALAETAEQEVAS